MQTGISDHDWRGASAAARRARARRSYALDRHLHIRTVRSECTFQGSLECCLLFAQCKQCARRMGATSCMPGARGGSGVVGNDELMTLKLTGESFAGGGPLSTF